MEPGWERGELDGALLGAALVLTTLHLYDSNGRISK